MRKCNVGVTLLELVIAIGVLAVLSVPVMTMTWHVTRTNAQAHTFTQAQLVAQQRVEELVGRTFDDLTGTDSFALSATRRPHLGFYVRETMDGWGGTPRNTTLAMNIVGPPRRVVDPAGTILRLVTVYVYSSNSDAAFLLRQENVMRISQ